MIRTLAAAATVAVFAACTHVQPREAPSTATRDVHLSRDAAAAREPCSLPARVECVAPRSRLPRAVMHEQRAARAAPRRRRDPHASRPDGDHDQPGGRDAQRAGDDRVPPQRREMDRGPRAPLPAAHSRGVSVLHAAERGVAADKAAACIILRASPTWAALQLNSGVMRLHQLHI